MPKSRSEEGDENSPLTAKLKDLPERFQPVKTSGKLPILNAVRKRTEEPVYATVTTAAGTFCLMTAAATRPAQRKPTMPVVM